MLVSGVGSSMSASSTYLSLRVGPPVCWFQGWGPPCLLDQPTVFKSGTSCMLVSGVGSSMSADSTNLSFRVGPSVCWFQGWGPPCLLDQPTCL